MDSPQFEFSTMVLFIPGMALCARRALHPLRVAADVQLQTEWCLPNSNPEPPPGMAPVAA